ncbi:HAD family hydrolase [Aeromonas jandaei]
MAGPLCRLLWPVTGRDAAGRFALGKASGDEQDCRSLFDGLAQLTATFSTVPHGICSQNSQRNIRSVLAQHGVNEWFHSVVGYDDVPAQMQKPHPCGGLKCLESMFGQASGRSLIYIGDHEADVQFARNLQEVLGKDSRVISVAVAYSHSAPERWTSSPAHDIEELRAILGLYVTPASEQ